MILLSNKLFISKRYCCSGKKKKIPFNEIESKKLFKDEKVRHVDTVLWNLKKPSFWLCRNIISSLKSFPGINISPFIINLFKSYLDERSQAAKIKSVVSKISTCPEGIPLGLVLDPLLILIYINDLLPLSHYCRGTMHTGKLETDWW